MATNKRSFAARLMLVLVLTVLALAMFWFLQSGRLGFEAQTFNLVTVNAPNGGECFVPGASTTISWTKYAGEHVDIYFRPQGTSSGQSLIASSNYGTTQAWTVPQITTTTARIYIELHDAFRDPDGPPEGPPFGLLNVQVHAHNAVLGSDASDAPFTVSTECAPPVISNVAHSNITTNSATITWATNQNASSYVDYGTSTSYGSTAGSGSLVTNHSVGLAGLSAGTTYHYRVRSVNSLGRQSLSSDRTFTTVSNPPPATLSVTLTANPASGQAPLNGVDLTAQVSGTATGSIRYRFDCTNNGSYERDVTTSTNPYSAVDLCSYPSAGTYTARVVVDRGGLSANVTRSITVSSSAGTTPPSVTPRPPTGGGTGSRVGTPGRTGTSGDRTPPTITDVVAVPGSVSAVVTWTTNEPASSFVDYGPTSEYGTTAGQDELVTAHTVTLLNLTPATTYNFRVYSEDAAGNGSRLEGNTLTTQVEGSLNLPTITDMLINGVSVFGAGGGTPGRETVKMKVGDTLTVKGTALAGASVSMFVLSEERLFTTTADEAGSWTVDVLTADLPLGEHTIEVATLTADGQATPRLFLASFIVEAAGSDQSAGSGGRVFWYVTAAIIFVFLFGAAFLYRKFFGDATSSTYTESSDSDILPPILTEGAPEQKEGTHLPSSNFVPPSAPDQNLPDEPPPPGLRRLM